MRHAVRQPAEEPAPEQADLDAKAVQVLGGLAGVVSGAQALMARCPDPQTAPLLRQFIVEAVSAGLHVEELRGELARYAEVNAGKEHLFEAGRAYERSLQSAPKVPRQRARHASGGFRQSPIMRRVQGVAFVGLLLKLRPLTPHAVKLAAAAVAVPAAGALVIGAVVITHPSPSGPYGSGTGAAPAATASAAPFPSSSLIAKTVVHPKAKRGSKKELLSASGLPLPCCEAAGPEPSASTPQSSAAPSPAVSVQVAGTLVVSPQSINLATAVTGTATVRIRAWGGDAPWSIQSIPPDLTLTLPDGTQVVPGQSYDLSQGQSADLTVGLALNLDGSTLVTFTVGPTTVSVTVPPPLPAVVPSPVASDISGLLPSPSSS